MFRKLLNVFVIAAMLVGFLSIRPAAAMQSNGDGTPSTQGGQTEKQPPFRFDPNIKAIKDQPNRLDYMRAQERMRLLKQGKTAEAAALAQTGTDRVLVLLVEYPATDVFTWTAGVSHWDPLGIANTAEDTGTNGDCSKIITQTRTFTYSGPVHNQLPRPLSASDRSGTSIWTPNFSPQWFTDFMFGNGVVISYTRQDSSPVYYNFMGQSVRDFYEDLSGGQYTINGDVIGWLPMPHSTWYYDADQCPGARSTTRSGIQRGGLINGGGSARDLIKDALRATNAISNTIPGFDWRNYDQNGDGVIDRLWVVHAGYGEEDSTTLLNRTDYGEAAVWSHSSSIGGFMVDPVNNISAGPYIVMPENGGIGVFAHEYAHNLGAMDLYAYNDGETSAGFWTTMADDWTGAPIGFEPPSMDPMHLDWWGWLNPVVVNDPSQVYEVKIGQASRFPGGADMTRGVRIDLPQGQVPQPVPVWQGDYYWWGGKADEMNSRMTTVNKVNLAGATAPKLSFDLTYDLEDQWDYLWVQASEDGSNWTTITNTNQVCTHVDGWIGTQNGFPDDLCGAGIYGFTGYNASWPAPEAEEFDLSRFIGKSIYLRLWYMTDWGTTYTGAFVDNVKVADGATTIFADDAESGDANWTYAPDWARSNGFKAFDQSFYVQWRNTSLSNGGYDSALGEPGWRYGPANTGLVMWYENQAYTDNEVFSYLTDYPSYGPKGRMLVVDSQPEPYRSPYMAANSYNNEGGNLEHRGQMRDAPFTLADTVPFDFANTSLFPPDAGYTTTHFSGRTAVSTFHDALGYYPGAEWVKRAPASTNRWVTKQWDASTVVPSQSFYALKAPGYDGYHSGTAANEFRYNCAPLKSGGLWYLSCYYFGAGTGLGYYGGNGNPADVDGQYGWHVQLVEQAADNSWAKVRIWNSQYAVDSTLTPAATTYNVGDTIPYTAQFKNTGSEMSYLACVSFDTSKVAYVPGSAGAGALELESCPAAALVAGQPLAPVAGSTVGAVAWVVNDALPGALSPVFNFALEATAIGTLAPQSSISRFGGAPLGYSATKSPDVFITEDFAVSAGLVPSATYVKIGQTVDYTANFKNVGNLPMDYMACVSIDTSKFEYMAGSASGDPLELASCPTSASAPEAAAGGTVGALAWNIEGSMPGTTESFTFQVKALSVGTTAAAASVVKAGTGGNAGLLVDSPTVTIDWWYAFLPAILR